MSVEATLSPADLGALIDKSADWVERRVNGGDHEHLRVGRSMRFTPEQADSFIRSFTARPAGSPSAAPDSDPLRSQSSRSRNRRKTTAA